MSSATTRRRRHAKICSALHLRRHGNCFARLNPTVGGGRRTYGGGAEADDSFDGFYGRHHRAVWKKAFTYLQDHHEAEDVVQEPFVKAWRHLHRCRPDASRQAWVLAICRN